MRDHEKAVSHLPTLRSWCVLVLATIVFSWPLLTKPLPNASDSSYHSQFAYGFVGALTEGVVYPRWISDGNRGFGAPDFVIYPPLGFYAIGAAYVVTGDVLEALRWVLILGAFASAVAFFAATRELTTELGATVGSVLYLLLPYRYLDLYDRFALAEYLAFVWFPLLFWAVRRLAAAPSWNSWFGLCASFAGLLLTHSLSAYLIVFVLGPYALVHIARSGHWRSVAAMAAAGLAGALLCSVYLVPLLTHRKDVHLDWLETPHYDWRRNFIYRDEVAYGQEHGLRFKKDIAKPWAAQSGTTQAMLALAAGGLLALRLRRGHRLEGGLYLALSFWALFLQTPLSTPLWQYVPALRDAQFPWRFSTFQMLAVAFLAACALAPCRAPVAAGAGGMLAWMRTRLCARPGLTVALLAAAAVPALVVSARTTSARPYTYTEAVARDPAYRYRVVNEYFPRGVDGWQNWQSMPFPTEQNAAALNAPGQIEELSWSTHERHARVTTPGPNQLVLRTFVFPGWRAFVDGAEVPIRSDNRFRAIGVDVPAGMHDVSVVFGSTPDSRTGAAISGATLLGLLGLAAVVRRRDSSGGKAMRP